MVTATTRIVIASKNPVKAAAIHGAFEKMFPDTPYGSQMIAAESGVGDQPMSDAETRRGAENRLESIRQSAPNADLWCALEGGIEDTGDMMMAFAWILIENQTLRGAARSASFPLPHAVAQCVRSGVELGTANDQLFQHTNSKQHQGAIGILTEGRIDRRALYEPAAIMAMIPLLNESLFATPADATSPDVT